MDNIEILKEELKNQKAAIEDKAGTVIVKRKNPSPSEITEGIKSIPIPDLTVATATELDVALGKTFFSGDDVLKTGCAVGDVAQTNALFMPKLQTVTYDSRIFYTIPEGITFLRSYVFYNNYNPLTITINEDVQRIGDYAFYNAKDTVVTNFHNLTSITKVGVSSFQGCSKSEIDTANLPNTITSLGTSCFMDVAPANAFYKLPDNVTEIGQSTFRSSSRKLAKSIDLTNITKTNTLSAYMVYYLAFDCDFVVSSSIKTIGSYFNYNGSFHNVYIASNVSALNSYCFGAASNLPLSDFYLNKVVFESENPPNCGAEVFANQHIRNGLKIYVPDNAVDAYKAVTNLQKYVNYIYPTSEMD